MSTLCFNRSSISSFNEHNSISDPFGGEGKIEEGLIPAYFFEKSVHVCTYIYIYIYIRVYIYIDSGDRNDEKNSCARVRVAR